jgi:hypothetical protein
MSVDRGRPEVAGPRLEGQGSSMTHDQRVSQHRAGRGQVGQCPTDEVHRPLPSVSFAKSRYAEARTDAAAVTAAVLPGGVIQVPPKFYGQRRALVGLLPFMRTDLRTEYHQLICQEGRQVSRALACYANVWTITGPATAVAGPTSRGARLCSIQASARLFASSAPA